MAMLPGRCVNVMYCTTAAEGEIVRVPADARFTCPQCSKPLVPPNTPLRRRAPGRTGRTLDKPASIVIGGGGFMCGMLLGMIIFDGGFQRIAALFTPAPTMTTEARAETVSKPVATPPPAPKPAEPVDQDSEPAKVVNHHSGRHSRHKQ